MARPKPAKERPTAVDSTDGGRDDLPNPIWFKPLMFGFMLIGLVWIIVFYLSQTSWPIPGLGVGNIAIGFGFLIIGFFMTTRWR